MREGPRCGQEGRESWFFETQRRRRICYVPAAKGSPGINPCLKNRGKETSHSSSWPWRAVGFSVGAANTGPGTATEMLRGKWDAEGSRESRSDVPGHSQSNDSGPS